MKDKRIDDWKNVIWTTILGGSNGFAAGEMLKLLRDHFGLTAALLRTHGALEKAVFVDRHEVVRVLHTDFGFDGDDARADNNSALREAVKMNSINLLRVLHEEYGLNRSDARQANALIGFVANRNREAVRLLRELYKLNIDDVLVNNRAVLRRAVDMFDSSLLEELKDYGLSGDQLYSTLPQRLPQRMRNNHFLHVINHVYGITNYPPPAA